MEPGGSTYAANEVTQLMLRSRRFGPATAASVLIATAVVLGSAPTSAYADTPLPVPTALGTSPAPAGGASGDACGAQAPYGYIGLNDVTFSATASWPVNPQGVSMEFDVVGDDGSAPLDYTESAVSGFPASLRLPSSDFNDGATYTWQARTVDSTGDSSAWSTPCHFIADHVAPVGPVASSTDFPSSNSGLAGPVARTTGTVTFALPGGSAGDATRFYYDLDGTPAVSPGTPESDDISSGNSWVPVSADGTATITITPTEAAQNWIDVQTMDRAGNVSQPVRYSFNLGWPNQDVNGDLNGDGHLDLVAATSAGTLFDVFGNGDGTVQPAKTFHDETTDWSPGLIAQSGNYNGDAYQDILRINPNGVVVENVNNGLGDFSEEVIANWYRADGTDWSKTTQFVLPGPVDGADTSNLVTVENNQLLLWTAGRFGLTGGGTPIVLDATFKGWTVITPGDVNGDGLPDLLLRDNANGKLKLALEQEDGTYGAPSTWRVVGHGFSSKKYRLIVSVGDANGDGTADLYAVTKAGSLVFVPGGPGNTFGSPVTLTTTGIDWTQVTSLA
jgi:hypothetical protein